MNNASEFLTYQLLSEEDESPVRIRITGQRERGFPDWKASNGIIIASRYLPAYFSPGWTSLLELMVWGRHHGSDDHDNTTISIPKSDWPLVRNAIAECNEVKRHLQAAAHPLIAL